MKTLILGTAALALSAGMALASDTMLGTVALIEKKRVADVLLRYNFPGGGLTDDALRTLILMVLSTGVEVRQALTG